MSKVELARWRREGIRLLGSWHDDKRGFRQSAADALALGDLAVLAGSPAALSRVTGIPLAAGPATTCVDPPDTANIA